MNEQPRLETRIVGRLPEPYASVLGREGLLLLAEGVQGSLFMPYFRAPGKISWRHRRWLTVTLALSNARFLVIRHVANPVIHVPLSDPRFRKIRFDSDGDTLVVAHDAGLFRPDWSGELEYRFRVPDAGRWRELLQQNAPLSRPAADLSPSLRVGER